MIFVTFKRPDDMIEFVSGYFDHNYEDEWLEDPLVREMVLDVDNSEIVSPYCVISPILGQIPITKISAGIKAVILMLKQDKPVWTPACGDNCTKWIAEVGKVKDITIFVGHYLHFADDFDAVCIDDNRQIHTVYEWEECMLDHFLADDYYDGD